MSVAPPTHTGPRTSVIIPARNASATLSETLDSVLAQSDGDWEAVLIDDGSTDGTAALVSHYCQRDPRFLGLRGPGAGVSAARNAGLSRARGRRLLFLDSDDWIDRRFLELMNRSLDGAPGAVAALCARRRVMPDGRLAPVASNPEIARAPLHAFARSCATAIHSVLIEREVITSIDGFDTTLRTCEDWDLWQRAARQGGAWVHVDEVLSYYRVSASSLSTDVDQLLADARIVIGRGFATEPSTPSLVSGQADHEAGRWDGAAAEAYAYFVLWCAAFDCGRGGTGTVLHHAVESLPSTPAAARSIVNTLVEGVCVGLRVVPQQLAASWATYGARMTTLIEMLGAAWNDPVAARRIQYSFERVVLDYDDLAEVRLLSLTAGLRVDLRAPAAFTPTGRIDRVYAYLCHHGEVLAILDVGALGTITTRDWVELALSRLNEGSVVRRAGPGILATLTPGAMRTAVRGGARAARTAPWRSDLRRAIRGVTREVLLGAATAEPVSGAHRDRLDALHPPSPGPGHGGSTHAGSNAPTHAAPCGADRQAYWEQLFRLPDPWRYGSAYEQEKYARQLSLLPASPINRALELACAEGHFTDVLASRATHLVATDISQTALDRARARCAAHTNIEFRQFDLISDDLPAALDLIVCSEVLYYLEETATLEHVARRITAALKPGGHFLTAHAFVLQDDRSRTGFDWGHRWGATTIAHTLSATPGLALERSIQTELYRIDLFVRTDAEAPAPVPVIERAPIDAELEDRVARFVVWGGATARRDELKVTERHSRLPVLMYHSVSDEGPAALGRYRVTPAAFRAQMHWLRQQGYHTITSDELCWFLQDRHPFVGRPVVITFDDGLQTFADAAWPILRRCDFGAEMFIVTDLVGQTSTWEDDPRDATQLMDAATIMRLAGEGVSFGSHLATHRCADGLSTHDLADELVRSRAMLRQLIGQPITAMAAPFGLGDERARILAAQCGYRIAYSTTDMEASLTSDPLSVPRIEVRGSWSLDEFAARLENSR